ncbi:MAG: hypothetical protein NTZ95_00560 [Candidatus Omnitrophica bacterium]|nr:hypothetical protein [Candidatus Omnitrophota bacterium]
MVIKRRVKAKARRKLIKKSKPGKTARPKKAVKRPASKLAKKQTKKAVELNFEKVGEVTHYFPHVKAAAVMVLKGGISVGDRIYIKGHTTDFKEKVNSIQLDLVSIQAGKKGQEIGLLVKSRVRIGDSVYRI